MRAAVRFRWRHSARVLALVDTGASFSAIPRSLAKRIGATPVGRVRVELAGGSRRIFPAANAYVRVDGREILHIVLVVPQGEALLGAETLELLGMAVDPRHQRLVAARPFKIMLA